MTKAAGDAIMRYRRRMKGRGMVRVEVRGSEEGAPLVRAVARTLTDPARASEAPALRRAARGGAQGPACGSAARRH